MPHAATSPASRGPTLTATTTLAPPAAAAEPWTLEGYHKVPRPMRPGRAPRPLKILFLYSRPPLPMGRGDELTASPLLEFLHARRHQVACLTMVRRGHRCRDEHAAWRASRCRRVETVELTKAEGLREAALGLARGWPVHIGHTPSPAQQAK